MRKPGAVTVFLSLVVVCILSLLMGLLESARTVGARLYLQMAADSAVSSVMSQYNRNLWEMYDLMFLEYGEEEALTRSFEEFFSYYEEQENLYPMKLAEISAVQTVKLADDGGEPLEKEITDYIRYRLPEAAADLAGLAADAAQAAKAGDFESLLTVSRQAGRAARSLEKKRAAVEDSMEDMETLLEKTVSAAEKEKKGKFLRNGKKLKREMEGFSGLVDAYETELEKLEESQETDEAKDSLDDAQAETALSQEISACGEVLDAAREALAQYREKEQAVEAGLESLEMALALAGGEEEEEAEEEEDEEDEEEGPDWDEIQSCLEDIELPEAESGREIDEDKAAALDQLEELFDKELLALVLPEGKQVSEQKIVQKTARGTVLSTGSTKEESEDAADASADSASGGADAAVTGILVGEYILLFFDSFLETGEGGAPAEEKPLRYEQEYLLNGENSDRENLSGTVQRLLSIRGAANLLYLLNEPEMKAQADALAAAVTAGAAPVQFIVSFLILALWAFGEAVMDVRELLAGGKVPLWKSAETWRTSLDGLLTMEFLSGETGGNETETGSDYEAYMRILLFLTDRGKRNQRMLELIERNVQKTQADFSVSDCAYQMELTLQVKERHLFLLKSEYADEVTVSGGY